MQQNWPLGNLGAGKDAFAPDMSLPLDELPDSLVFQTLGKLSDSDLVTTRVGSTVDYLSLVADKNTCAYLQLGLCEKTPESWRQSSATV